MGRNRLRGLSFGWPGNSMRARFLPRDSAFCFVAASAMVLVWSSWPLAREQGVHVARRCCQR
eukprot:1854448-Prorocentrum_lima.AAC.1